MVGTGPAGIHMAMKLKKIKEKKYKVAVFEKTDRVGGKCYGTKDKEGRVLPQGAVFLQVDYFPLFQKLAAKYGNNEILEFAASGVCQCVITYFIHSNNI